MGQYGHACPKPEKRARAKARVKRQASAVEQRVRAQVVARDGDCRVGASGWPAVFGPCGGESEWAHLEDKRRFKTRGQPAEVRHTTAGSLMLCTAHHRAYDLHELFITPLTGLGADSTLRMIHHHISVLSLPPHSEVRG
jgi:hypothetical protein